MDYYSNSVFGLVNALFRWDAVSGVAAVATALAALKGLSSIREQLKALSSQESAQTLQLELQSKQLRLNHVSEYTKRYQEIILHLPSNIGSSDFEMSNFQKGEREVISRYMRAYFDLCYEEWELHRRRLIDSDMWNVWKDGISKTVVKVAFKQAWSKLSDPDSEFGEDFKAFISSLQNGVMKL